LYLDLRIVDLDLAVAGLVTTYKSASQPKCSPVVAEIFNRTDL